jgi:YbgC/YbaW family acyl-CoA thioester hydrolase
MNFPVSFEFPVRGYEIDLWGHVNNAVYLNWLEQARWMLFTDTELGQIYTDAGIKPVVRHIEIDFRAETVFGDTVRIDTWPRKAGNTSVTLGNSITIVGSKDPKRLGKLATVASVLLVCVRSGFGKVEVPGAVRDYFPTTDPGFEPV